MSVRSIDPTCRPLPGDSIYLNDGPSIAIGNQLRAKYATDLSLLQSQGDIMTRTWKCPGCGRTIRHSYEALAEVGNPICSNEDCADFDDELELLPETKTRLAIVLEGGLVTAVVSDHPERFADVDTIVIDYDTEGADAQDITFVPQGKSKTAEALVRRETIEQASDLDIVCRNLNGEKTS